MVKITVKKGDITKEKCDAIVNPANSLGLMGGGVALAIKRAGGEEIEREVIRKAPIPIGSAVATTAGKLPCRAVIHAPTMERPAERTDTEKVALATRAALDCAQELGIKTITFPGMGTGVGGIEKEIAADTMINEIKKFINKKDLNLTTIVLIGFDEIMTNAFLKNL